MKDDKTLVDVWAWKDQLSIEDKDLSMAEKAVKIRQEAEAVAKELGLELNVVTAVYRAKAR
ncbi:MAG: hypothetical protein HY347_05025 [candidate division NC10 bacterium]|nr:hypothetical protein [candidate division NC10 bacterium]